MDHIQHTYKCENCSQHNLSDKIIKADVPKGPISHSLGSASVVAHTLSQKYELKAPCYRQEKYWARIDFNIDRNQISNWHIHCAEHFFTPVYDLLFEKLHKQEIIRAVETPYNVLASQKAKTYFWALISSRLEKRGCLLPS